MTTKQPGDRRNGTALPEIREGRLMWSVADLARLLAGESIEEAA